MPRFSETHSETHKLFSKSGRLHLYYEDVKHKRKMIDSKSSGNQFQLPGIVLDEFQLGFVADFVNTNSILFSGTVKIQWPNEGLKAPGKPIDVRPFIGRKPMVKLHGKTSRSAPKRPTLNCYDWTILGSKNFPTDPEVSHTPNPLAQQFMVRNSFHLGVISGMSGV